MLDAELWRDVVPRLAEFGPIKYSDLSRDGSINDMAHRALAEAPSTFTLVGYSMGGYVAREIVRQAPERVSALILIATSARGDTEQQRQRKSAITARSKEWEFKGLSTSAVVSSLHTQNAQRVDLIDRVKKMAHRLGAEVFRRQSLICRGDERHLLATIRCPCLVIAGEKDKLRSLTEAVELHQGIEGSTFQIIRKTGHLIPLEAPVALADAISTWMRSIEAQ